MPPPPRIARSAPQLHSTKRLQPTAPQYTGRFSYLLTLKRNTFRLTKVNKLYYNEQIINELRNTNCNARLQQKAAELTKSAYSNINEPNHQPIPCVPIALPYLGSAVVLSEHQGTIRNHEALISGSFSLVRFFWRSNKSSDSLRQLKRYNGRNKRNEQKLGRVVMAEGENSGLIELRQVNTCCREIASCVSVFTDTPSQ